MKILSYRILLKKEAEGGYTVIVPVLPGCVTYGDTIEEAIKMAKEAIQLYIESLQEHGEEIPYEEFDDIEEKEQKLYFTQKDLATMTGQSIRNIQRIIKENNINPINPGRKPLYYDLKEFNNYYFIQKN